MERFYKEDRGVISIFIVVFLPVIIIGGLMIFDFLQVYQRENKAFKVAYACSDSVLSQYNAYLYDAFALYANHNVTDVSALVSHYFEKNGLLNPSQKLNIAVKYERLNEVDTFSQAVRHASLTQLGNIAENHTMDIIGQFELSDRIRNISERFNFSELKLVDRFELKDYKEGLSRIMGGEYSVKNLEIIRNEQVQLFQEQINQLYNDFAALSLVEQDTIGPYKLTEWEETSKLFFERTSQLQAFENEVITLESMISQLKQEAVIIRDSINAIEIEIRESNEADALEITKDHLETLLNQLNQEVSAIKSQIVDRAGALYQEIMGTKPDLINQMHALISEIAVMAMGIDISDGNLALEEKYRYSNNPEVFDPWAIQEKLLVNEYYLSLFSSYDLNSPRALDPLNRMDTPRVLKGEIEYILTGKPNEKESMNWITAELLALRLPSNLLSILSDSEKMRRISNYTLAIPQPWRMVAFTAVLTAWVTAESYLDVMALLKGEGLHLLKTSADWHLDLDTLINRSWQTKKQAHAFDKIYYQDYLRIMLFLRSEVTSLKRVMELMTTEVLTITQGAYDLSHFSRGHELLISWRSYAMFNWIKKDSTVVLINNYDGIVR